MMRRLFFGNDTPCICDTYMTLAWLPGGLWLGFTVACIDDDDAYIRTYISLITISCLVLSCLCCDNFRCIRAGTPLPSLSAYTQPDHMITTLD